MIRLTARIAQRWETRGTPLPTWIVEALCRHAQRVAERRRREQRRALRTRDERLDRRLAFAGRETVPRERGPRRSSPTRNLART